MPDRFHLPPTPPRRVPLATAALVLILLIAVTWFASVRDNPHSIAVAPLVASGNDRTVETLRASLTAELRDALIGSGQWKVTALPHSADIAGRTDTLQLRSNTVVVLPRRGGGHGRIAEGLRPPHRRGDRRRIRRPASASPLGALLPRPRTGKHRQCRPRRGEHRSVRREHRKRPPILPWAGLANANLHLADLDREKDTPQRLDRARSAARQAIALDESNAEAHAMLGQIHLDRDWNFRRAVNELRRAVELDPISITPALLYSRALSMIGDLTGAQEAIAVAKARLPAIPDPCSRKAASTSSATNSSAWRPLAAN